MNRRVVLCLAALLALAGPAFSQGLGYFNVESPQVHPIEVAHVDGRDLLLVCNTPDSSLEIWDTDESVPIADRLLARVPVGLEPVSVRWVSELQRAYVVSFLGDSISAIDLSFELDELQVQLVMTKNVTDEPMDLAFGELDVNGTPTDALVVTHKALDAIGKYDATTLEPLFAGAERIDAAVDTGQDIDFDGADDAIALKEPRTTSFGCNGDRLFVLGQKGGNTIRYDFDLYSEELATGATTAFGALGSSNANMIFGDSDRLYVVGGMALNTTLFGEPTVAEAPTGFVKSMLYVIEDVCTGTPSIYERDLNLIYRPDPLPVTQALRTTNRDRPQRQEGYLGPVLPHQALAQPTDVIEFTPTGEAPRLFVAAFSSDRIGVVEPDIATDPREWPIRRIEITPHSAAMAGPRALAFKPAAGGDPARLYVLNRIDNSVTIIDPVSETVVDTFPLDRNPTPQHVTDGRPFLYDADLSGNGFVSCSSCHVDGRTDGLAWDLSDGVAQPIPDNIYGFEDEPGEERVEFPADKGFMVTQSLQGLLNWEVPRESQPLFTNAPYHWRGDRATFLDFNGAFPALMEGSELSDADMIRFETFINSIHYPPNPKQPRTRVYSGDPGNPNDIDMTNGDSSGEGAQRGLRIFHVLEGNACAMCHALPSGSSNVLARNLLASFDTHPAPQPPFSANINPQPIEPPSLRHAVQKEARLDRNGSAESNLSPVTGYEGLFHSGVASGIAAFDFNAVATFNGFNRTNVASHICGSSGIHCPNVQSLNQFLHELDTGSGGMIGRSHTVTLTNKGDNETSDAFDAIEGQAAVANAGAIVHLFPDTGLPRGFWFDPSGNPPAYREDLAFGAGSFTRAQLLTFVDSAGDRLVVSGAPLGHERSLASPGASPAPLIGPAPSELAMQHMRSNTAHVKIHDICATWSDEPADESDEDGTIQTHTIRVLQYGLINDGPVGGFGLEELRWDAPRRFRVSGKDIRHGAKLHLSVPVSDPPDTDIGPKDSGQVETLEIVLPLHPTGEVDNSNPIWETSTEMEPRLFYRLMAGRPEVAGVMVGLTDRDYDFAIQLNAVGVFSPVEWNRHHLRVVNEDGSSADGGWVPLTIATGPDCPAP